MREYKIYEGSVHQQFLLSRAPIQIFGGGFGNGKTAASVIKAIQMIQGYPGSNGLIARETFPKLNDTIRREFKVWCPPKIIASFPESKNSDNTAKFTNGSAVNFRYIQQQGKTMEQSTSNLLSATYDWAIIDQMEDPGITYKDFLDIQGRLRGNTIYRGNDPTMPRVGPQFLIMTVNPTGNWFFTQIIRPLKLYQSTGKITDELLCRRDPEGRPILDQNGKPYLIVELFEGPTYINRSNLTTAFIERLESTYRGDMKRRFLLGDWASYEGLIYPQFSPTTNMVSQQLMRDYLDELIAQRYQFKWVEGYDFGIASPSCYLLGFVDPHGAVHVVDGFYKSEFAIENVGDTKGQAATISEIRERWGAPDDYIFADPSIFRRTSKRAGTVGTSTSGLFWDAGKIKMKRGNNDIANGIVKVGSYLSVQKNAINPYTGDTNAPMLYFSDELQWVSDEFTGYMWKKDPTGRAVDEPVDKNDHAMDTIKYMLSDRPDVGRVLLDLQSVPSYMKWREVENNETPRYARYGNG